MLTSALLGRLNALLAGKLKDTERMRQREHGGRQKTGADTEVTRFGGKQKSSEKRTFPEQRQVIEKSLESRQQLLRGLFPLSGGRERSTGDEKHAIWVDR